MIINEQALSLEEKVYFQLKEEILSGELKPGTHLGETALAKRIGTSRTPVRSALHRLFEEGHIEFLPNKGAKVAGITKADIEEIYAIRMRLEGLAARLAAERMTDAECSELRRITNLASYNVKTGRDMGSEELDTSFHSIIFKASGSRHLCRILSDLHKSVQIYRRYSFQKTDRAQKTIEEHQAILNAILAKDPEEAERLAVTHVQNALDNFELRDMKL
jgi:DNA-binding GntR family transcriptional regulator